MKVLCTSWIFLRDFDSELTFFSVQIYRKNILIHTSGLPKIIKVYIYIRTKCFVNVSLISCFVSPTECIDHTFLSWVLCVVRNLLHLCKFSLRVFNTEPHIFIVRWWQKLKKRYIGILLYIEANKSHAAKFSFSSNIYSFGTVCDTKQPISR